ncbi:hypothetical protein [Salinicoccus sp. Marseille-QA3877]
MKNLIFLFTFSFILASCGSPSAEEQLSSAEAEKEELEELLQTETVKLERNSMKLETLENEISQAETSQNDENVQLYIDTIDEYTKSLVTELESLNQMINEDYSSDNYNNLNENIDTIIENIDDIISTYETEVNNLELNETLMRRHNSLEVAHADMTGALEQIKTGAANNDNKTVQDGITALNSISEFY